MKTTINLNNVLCGKYSQGWNNEIIISENEKLNYFQEYKKFLLSHCRKGSKPYMMICHFTYEELETYGQLGIYNRVIFDLSTMHCRYVAGQSYPEEIATLKDIVKKASR